MCRCTVLLPFRDAEHTLAECLESILGQSVRDFEVLAVNDGSSDASVSLVSEFARNPTRLE